MRIYEALLTGLTKAIEHYGGTVTSAAENGVAGLFGVPLMFEDHAIRACYAATDIQSTMLQSLSGISVAGSAHRHRNCQWRDHNPAVLGRARWRAAPGFGTRHAASYSLRAGRPGIDID